MNIKILVAAHKAYPMPADHDLYLPVHVGKALHPDLDLGYQGDDQGENISAKNSSYNELTAMYWAWKNLDAEAIGLVHYRRHLALGKQKDLTAILNQQEVENLLGKTDIILPKQRKYYIESNYSHYAHAHHVEPLDAARAVLVAKYPRYVPAFDKVMKQTSAHMFNMFIMKRAKFDSYATWLFDVLGEVEAQTDTTGWNDYEKRVYGFVSELLLDVWLDTNEYQYTEVNFVHMEKQNWPKKIANFLLRKLGKREIQ